MHSKKKTFGSSKHVIEAELQMTKFRLRQNLRSEARQRAAWFCGKEIQSLEMGA